MDRIPGQAATGKRWSILALLFLMALVNLGDRSAMSIAAPEVKKAFAMTAVEMGYIFSAFAWSYVVAQLPGGWLLDRFGSKTPYFFCIFLWSLVTLFHGVAGLVFGGAVATTFFVLRLLLGATQAPTVPGNVRIASSWFPTSERGTAMAIMGSTQYCTTVVFMPFMGWLVYTFGWQSVFFVMGILGIVMSFVWLYTMYVPKTHPTISKNEYDYIAAGGALVDLDETRATGTKIQIDTWFCLKQLLCNRMLLGVYIGQYCITTLTYFFATWFPAYLVHERHMTILKAGFVAPLPALAGFLGGVLGGVLSDRLLKAGSSLSIARKAPIVCGMLMAMSMIACNYAETDAAVVAIMSMAFFGKGLGSLGWTVLSDVAPKTVVGLSGGLFNTFGNLAGIATPIIVGYIVQGTGSFAWALAFVSASAFGAILSYLLVVGRIERVTLKTSPVSEQ